MQQGAQKAVIVCAVRQCYVVLGVLFNCGCNALKACAGRCLAHVTVYV